MPHTARFTDQRARLRSTALARRSLARQQAPGADEAAARQFLQAFPVTAATRIALYAAIGTEIDPAPLAASCRRAGATLALPVVIEPARPLIFRHWGSDTPLEPGPHGTQHPGPKMPEITPDLLIIPLLAVDNAGNRLGYGGGFYDRTLAQLRAQGRVTAIGFAFEAQIVDRIAHDRWDEPLDHLVTEERVRHFRPSIPDQEAE